MADWIKVIILSIVQGITEFLPISSTGHLIVAVELLNFQRNIDGTFEIFIQLGSVLAVVFYYREDLWRQVRTVRSDRDVQKLWLNIVVAAIPAAIVGFLLRDFITEVLFSPAVVGVMLILGGIAFLVIDRPREGEDDSQEQAVELSSISMRQALMVGVIQVLALIPGTSRSGSSIIGGLLSGLNRPTAAAFSFYLAIPVLGGATIIDLLLNLDQVESDEWLYLGLGTVVTAIVSFIVIGWLLRFIARNRFTVFGYYRIIAGIVILGLLAVGIGL